MGVRPRSQSPAEDIPTLPADHGHRRCAQSGPVLGRRSDASGMAELTPWRSPGWTRPCGPVPFARRARRTLHQGAAQQQRLNHPAAELCAPRRPARPKALGKKPGESWEGHRGEPPCCPTAVERWTQAGHALVRGNPPGSHVLPYTNDAPVARGGFEAAGCRPARHAARLSDRVRARQNSGTLHTIELIVGLGVPGGAAAGLGTAKATRTFLRWSLAANAGAPGPQSVTRAAMNRNSWPARMRRRAVTAWPPAPAWPAGVPPAAGSHLASSTPVAE